MIVDIEKLATSAAHEPFSRSATYTPPGEDSDAVEVDVVLDIGVEGWDALRSRATDDEDYADFMVDEITPERGGVISDVDGYEGKSWEVGRRVSEDGHIVRHRIIPGVENA